jgi:hypothetical protein
MFWGRIHPQWRKSTLSGANPPSVAQIPLHATLTAPGRNLTLWRLQQIEEPSQPLQSFLGAPRLCMLSSQTCITGRHGRPQRLQVRPELYNGHWQVLEFHLTGYVSTYTAHFCRQSEIHPLYLNITLSASTKGFGMVPELCFRRVAPSCPPRHA